MRKLSVLVLLVGLTAVAGLVVLIQSNNPARPPAGAGGTTEARTGSRESIPLEPKTSSAAPVREPVNPPPEAITAVDASERAKDALQNLARYKIRPPKDTTFPSAADWERLADISQTIEREIRRTVRERDRIGREIAEQRRKEGRVQHVDITSPPSTYDPDWKTKWPWMDPPAGEWQRYETMTIDGTATAELVRVMPGDDPRMDALWQERQDLIRTLRTDVEELLRQRATR